MALILVVYHELNGRVVVMDDIDHPVRKAGLLGKLGRVWDSS